MAAIFNDFLNTHRECVSQLPARCWRQKDSHLQSWIPVIQPETNVKRNRSKPQADTTPTPEAEGLIKKEYKADVGQECLAYPCFTELMLAEKRLKARAGLQPLWQLTQTLLGTHHLPNTRSYQSSQQLYLPNLKTAPFAM